MKRSLLLTALMAASTIGAQAHIGWDLESCQNRYGQETKLQKVANAGEIHYFVVQNGSLSLSVIMRNDKVKEILYRKSAGEAFTSDQIDILQKKNQAELLGCEGIEWVSDSDPAAPVRTWYLMRQGEPKLQTLLVNQGTKDNPLWTLIIRTWDQIQVDKEAARQDQLDKLKNL